MVKQSQDREDEGGDEVKRFEANMMVIQQKVRDAVDQKNKGQTVKKSNNNKKTESLRSQKTKVK